MLNGRFYKEKEAVFDLTHLSGRAGGLVEVFRAEHNEVLFLESIARHLRASAEATGLSLEGVMDEEGKLLRKDVSRLLNKNKLYTAAEIEVQLYAAGSQINILLQAREIGRGYYPLNEPGLLLQVYRDLTKSVAPGSGYAPAGWFVQQAAARKAAELGRPNLIILNSTGFACESIGGSFACISRNRVLFPAGEAGGYRCAIREQVMQSVKEAGFDPVEQAEIRTDDLLDAEEVFLFDAVHGIRKVLGLEERRYFSPKVHLIAAKLSELAKKERDSKG